MTPIDGLWRGKAPLLLASESPARRALLAAAGIPFESVATHIDERALEAPLREEGAGAATIAAHLARAKALAVSGLDRLVVGADQILSLDGEVFAKPRDVDEAKAQLARLSGRSHELHSALCVARAETVLFETVARATLTCRKFSPEFIDRYVAAASASVLASVGAYQIEGLGVHLFERIEGDHATILGLPLIPLLAFLRQEGSLVG
ncbi:MAG TPA: Maf family nucleotide pyrophosphatase [Methylovirgula sp.]|nr:Maf family nucleotide pyrophosphatase [Methylovirgula sp.]